METIVVDELHSISFDSSEKISGSAPWHSLIHHFSYNDFEALRNSFKNNSENDKELGLTKNEFKEVVCQICGNDKYNEQSISLFDDIAQNEERIDWNKLLDFLIENISPKTEYPVQLHLNSIEPVPHMSRETVAKIVLIETDKYFCYAIVSKYGRIGIYDGNLNFLTSYHVIMTPEDITRNDNERRRRNRWVTDAVFCLDIQMFIVTNSTRSITIYEASGLKHEPYWLIIGAPEIIQCLAYKETSKEKGHKSKCILFGGTDTGDIILFKFVQPHISILKRKNNDKLNVFYWDQLRREELYVKVKIYKKIHSREIEQMEYNEKEDAIISCSKDFHSSLVKNFLCVGKEPFVLKMRKGCNCFAFSNNLNILVSGSDDRIIRIWNSVLVSNIIAILRGHNEKLIDVAIMESLQMVLSVSEDGVLKLWNINENKCLQTIQIKYPPFTTLGKFIEYGRNSLYPGPKRNTKLLPFKQENDLNKKYFEISDVEERPAQTKEDKSGFLNKWERSNILTTCCNFIASIKMTFENGDIERLNEMSILPPPPLQNSVLIPASWQIRRDYKERERSAVIQNCTKESIESLDFIINKDLFDIEGSKTDINYKIALLETKKIKMKDHVARGAPFLALDLSEIAELKLPDDLRIPDNKKIKKIVANIKKMLKDASFKDQVFSESSSNRSRLSSRSSAMSLE